MNRGLRHLLLAAGTAGAGLAAYLAGPTATGLDRLSMMLSWVCLVLFAAALVVGPAQALRTAVLVIALAALTLAVVAGQYAGWSRLRAAAGRAPG